MNPIVNLIRLIKFFSKSYHNMISAEIDCSLIVSLISHFNSLIEIHIFNVKAVSIY
jgi:DNA-binding SARP family transcriptional activator